MACCLIVVLSPTLWRFIPCMCKSRNQIQSSDILPWTFRLLQSPWALSWPLDYPSLCYSLETRSSQYSREVVGPPCLITFSQGTQIYTAYYPVYRILIYFVWFSSCLNQGDKSNPHYSIMAGSRSGGIYLNYAYFIDKETKARETKQLARDNIILRWQCLVWLQIWVLVCSIHSTVNPLRSCLSCSLLYTRHLAQHLVHRWVLSKYCWINE